MTSDKKNTKGTLPGSGDVSSPEKNVLNKNSQEDGVIKEKLSDISSAYNTSSNQDPNGQEKKHSKKNLNFRFFLLFLFVILSSIFFILNDDVTNKLSLFKNYLSEQYFKNNNDEVSDQIITQEGNYQDNNLFQQGFLGMLCWKI